MFFRQGKNAVQPSERDAYVWDRAKALAHANPGHFDQVIPIAAPDLTAASLSQVFGDVDQNGKTRLVILDPAGGLSKMAARRLPGLTSRRSSASATRPPLSTTVLPA
jgi:hypothetical protein